MARFLETRLPAREELWRVLGLVVFVVFSWSIVGFLYQLPAILLFMNFGDILGTLSYRLAFALLESLLVVAVLALLSALLPPAALKRGFAHKAFLIILTAAVASTLFEDYYPVWMLSDPGPAPYRPAAACVGVSGLVLAVLLLLMRLRPELGGAIDSILRRTSLFAYVYIPLGGLSLILVALRVLV